MRKGKMSSLIISSVSSVSSVSSIVRTRMEGNDQLYSQNNIEIVGNNNDIYGNNCVVVGKYNTIYGLGCTIFGTDNEVFTDSYFDYGVNTMEYKKVGRNFILVKGTEEEVTTGQSETSSDDLDTEIDGIDEKQDMVDSPIGGIIQISSSQVALDINPAIRNNIYIENSFRSTLTPVLGVSEVSEELIVGLQKHQDFLETDMTKKCCICMENRSIIAFNCGHKKTCKSCSVKILENDCRCPFCRESIVVAIRIFD